jgi:heterodisulfide reductase subunit A-like polyferredoxin
VEEVSGYIGNYESKIRKNGGEIIEFKHGIIVVATGGEEHRVSDYFYGENERVITQLELEKILYEERLKEYKPTSIVMIQCVEGREEGRLYCSRVCCGEAIKNAIKIKEKYKEKIEVYILYRDIRTYGLKEKYYTEARDKGVIFINYDLENKPKVEVEEEKLKVKVWDHFLSKYIVIDADLLVLSPPIVPASTNEELSKLLKVPLNEDKFFLEAHVKLRPIDFATDGIFVCGLAHNPKYIDESIAQAKGAAARALTILNRKFVEKEGTVCVVDENRCVGCGVCVNVCAYSGVELKEKIIEGVKQMVAYVNEAVCKGCGACSSTCKSGAIEVKGVSKESIVQAIKGGV